MGKVQLTAFDGRTTTREQCLMRKKNYFFGAVEIAGLILSTYLISGCAPDRTAVIYDPKSGAEGQVPKQMNVFEARKIVMTQLQTSTTTKTVKGQKTVLKFTIDSKQIGDKQFPNDRYVYGSLRGPAVIVIPAVSTTTKKNGEVEVRNVDAYEVHYNANERDGWTLCTAKEDAVQFVDAVLSLETYFTTDHTAEIDAELLRFGPIIADYHSKDPRPTISEDTRRFQVQAENALGEKDCDAAIRLYQKGLELSPWWPEGHYKLALVFEQEELLPEACKEVKKYLALAPEAADARIARDKLYGWEGKLDSMVTHKP